MNAIQIASYLVKRYDEEMNESITEMKLHKLLYFTQRESFIQLGRPIFSEKFQAWRYGPVMVQVRDLFKSGQLNQIPSSEELSPYTNVLNVIMKDYAPMDTWSLSDLTHAEGSWKKARTGLNPSDKGSCEMNTEDIKNDAFRVQLRRFELEIALS